MIVCVRCQDTGNYMGNGFMMVDCDLCHQVDEEVTRPAVNGINRKSKSYQKAILDIMSLNPDITRKEAITMFDNAYVKT